LASYKRWQIPGLLTDKNGRRRIKNRILYRLKSHIIPIASIYRKTLIRHVKVVAVVGSYGKITTTLIIAASLGNSPEKYVGTNNGVLVASGLLGIHLWAKSRVLEVGISKKGEMARNVDGSNRISCWLRQPGENMAHHWGISVTPGKKRQDWNVHFKKDGLAILNGDDLHVQEMRLYTKARVITHGYADNNDLRA